LRARGADAYALFVPNVPWGRSSSITAHRRAGYKGNYSFVVEALVALKAGRQPRRVVGIGNIAGRTRHTGPAAAASLVAAPGAVIMRLANPIGIPTAGAFHSGIHVSTSLARGQARVRNRGQQKPRLGGRGFKVTNLRRSSLPVVACNGSENSRCALSALQSIRELVGREEVLSY
jgi:hypothetical protein